MARIRTIKPEFWQDEKLAQLDSLSRLVFLGLISQADDAGRLINSVKYIDGILFPYTDETSRRSLDDLSRIGVIECGTTESGQAIIQIVNWHHQKIDRPNLKGSLPSIYGSVTKPRRSFTDEPPNHTNDLVASTNDPHTNSLSTREAGVENPHVGWDYPSMFGEFWQIGGKGPLLTAERAYYDHVPSQIEHTDLVKAFTAYKAKLDGAHEMNTANWISQKGYADTTLFTKASGKDSYFDEVPNAD